MTVALEGLTLTWPGAPRPTVDGLTLRVAEGSLTALLGPSGCGKTTVLRMIAGLLPPTAGDIAIAGRSVRGMPPEARQAVMVFQSHLLFPAMTVAANVGFGLRMRGLPRGEIAARVDEMLDLVRLPGLGARRPADLSGGQQQRVALARALVVRPEVLLLDEPLSNLDAHLRVEMRELIRSLQQRLRITTIFVTHDQEEAVVLADRVALMLDGRLRQEGAPADFYRRPADAAVARFFGGRNFVPGRVTGQRFDSALGPIDLPPGLPGGPGLLTFRPEALRLGPGPNAREAVVAARHYLGTQTRLELMIGDVVVEATMPPDAAEALGPGVTVHLPPPALWVMPPEAS